MISYLKGQDQKRDIQEYEKRIINKFVYIYIYLYVFMYEYLCMHVFVKHVEGQSKGLKIFTI
jgi:hypothetical protein